MPPSTEETLKLEYWAATDVGRQRDHNEDNFLIDKNLRLFVVADGMGGHAAGEVASSIAVHEVRDTLEDNRDLLERYARGEEVVPVELLQTLEHAVQRACATINRKAQDEQEKRGMGTTCSVLLFAGPPARPRGFIAHVGDSRIYLVRQEQTHQLTEDHSLMNELIRRGKVKREDFDSSPYRRYKNAVTRAVGVYESVAVDTFDFDVLPGDRFLLCSDGLHGYFDDDYQLADTLDVEDVSSVPKKLIDHANEAGGQDNITAICVRVPDTGHDADAADEVSLKLEVLRNMPLFKYLSYKELVRVMNITTTRSVAEGEVIFSRDDPGADLYVILTGEVRLSSGEATIASLTDGVHFGEMALVDRSPRSLTATAAVDTRLLLIPRRDIYEIIKKEPPLATKLLWSFVQVLASRLRHTTAELSGVRTGETPPDADLGETELFFEE